MNKPGFCEALSACCRCLTHEGLNVMPKGRVSAFDKVRCLPPRCPLLVASRQKEKRGQLLKVTLQQILSHCCCCHRFSGGDNSTHGSQKCHCKLFGCHKKERKRFVQEANCTASVLFKINLSPCTAIYLFRDYFCSHGFLSLLH